MYTIGQLDHGRKNNFNLLRFVAASMVIFSHSYWLTGNFEKEPLQLFCGIADFGSLGVKIFFCISGFLITRSLYTHNNLGVFAWSRLLRIIPGLVFTAIFCAFLIGPMSTELSLKKYFSTPDVYHFAVSNATFYHRLNTLPGVFTHNPIAGNVNAPLWTLPAEIFMYMCVVMFGAAKYAVKLNLKKLWALPVIIGVYVLIWRPKDVDECIYYFKMWGLLFFSGALCFIFKEHIKLSLPILLIASFAFLLLFHYRFKYIVPAFDLLLCYSILLFAYHPILQVKAFLKVDDLSYGLYICALPIQQLIIVRLGLLSPLLEFIISYPLALAVALFSWRVIEKPSLKLKNIFQEHLVKPKHTEKRYS